MSSNKRTNPPTDITHIIVQQVKLPEDIGDKTILEAVEDVSRKRDLIGIGWHFIVCPLGRILHGRQLSVPASTAPGYSYRGISVGVICNTKEDLNDKQVTAMEHLIQSLTHLYPSANFLDQLK